jgi:hypothetical protein
MRIAREIFLVSAIAVPALLASCVAPDLAPARQTESRDVAPARQTQSRDIQSCVAIFETTEEELGLTAEANFATGQRNYANWIEGMLGDAEDPMLRSYGLAAAGAARAAADKFGKGGIIGPDDGEVLITALFKVQNRCKQVMGIAE